MIAPPDRAVATETAAGEVRRLAGTGHDVENFNFQDITWGGTFDRHRTGADMHAEPFAGPAPVYGRVHWSGTAAVDGLVLPGPGHDVFSCGIARHHARPVIGGVLRQRLDGDDVAGADGEDRRQGFAEIAPMHAACVQRDMVMRSTFRLVHIPRAW